MFYDDVWARVFLTRERRVNKSFHFEWGICKLSVKNRKLNKLNNPT